MCTVFPSDENPSPIRYGADHTGKLRVPPGSRWKRRKFSQEAHYGAHGTRLLETYCIGRLLLEMSKCCTALKEEAKWRRSTQMCSRSVRFLGHNFTLRSSSRMGTIFSRNNGIFAKTKSLVETLHKWDPLFQQWRTFRSISSFHDDNVYSVSEGQAD